MRHWSATSLPDIFKETELKIGFTQPFQTSASRETLDRDTPQRLLLPCLSSLGTNAGLKRVLDGDESASYKELLRTAPRHPQDIAVHRNHLGRQRHLRHL